MQAGFPDNNVLSCVGTESHVTNRDGGFGASRHLFDWFGAGRALLR
jgi:hypothetical protein